MSEPKTDFEKEAQDLSRKFNWPNGLMLTVLQALQSAYDQGFKAGVEK